MDSTMTKSVTLVYVSHTLTYLDCSSVGCLDRTTLLDLTWTGHAFALVTKV